MSSNWPTVKTGEIFDLINGFAFKSKEFCDQGASVLKIKNVKAGYLALDNLAYVDLAYLSKKPDKVVQKNDLLITMSGNRHDGSMETWVGKVAWFNEDNPYLINQRVGILRLKDGLDINPRYMAYQLSSVEFQKHFIAVATSSGGQANLSPDQIKQTELSCPPRNIQDDIVNQIGSLEDKAQLNTQTNQTLEQIAQALFKSWFVDFEPVKAKIAVLEAGGTAEEAELAAMSMIAAKSSEQLTELKQSKPDAYEQLAQTAALFPSAMQESELGDIPEGWDVSSIEKSFKVIMGQSPKGDTYNEDGEGTLFYQGRAEFGWRFPSPRLYTTDPKRMANKGDVLMSVRAPVGDLNIALDDCCVGRGLCSLRHGSGSTTFTYYLLKQLQSKLNTFNGEGTVFGSINQKDLKSIQYISPNDKVIAAYRGLAEPLDNEIEILSVESNTLSSVRDSLLPRLLSGEFQDD
jgi:type I restriction enzyme S subunit